MAARVQGKGWVRAKVQEVTEVRFYIRLSLHGGNFLHPNKDMVVIFYTQIKIYVELFSNGWIREAVECC